VQKEAYKKLNRLFETFKKSEIKFKEYLDEQVDTYEKIKHDF
jgi:hypothetical protein